MNVFRLLRLLASFAIADVWLATVPESAGGWLTAAIQIRRAAWMNGIDKGVRRTGSQWHRLSTAADYR